MDKIKRLIECLFNFDKCNMRCSYCVLTQTGYKTPSVGGFEYPPEVIERSFSKERMGGICFFSVAGAGETLLAKELIPIIFGMLKQGHYVSVVTNGTITKRFEEILSFPKEFLERLMFIFSFHYVELKKSNMLDEFFYNAIQIRNAGCSFLLKMCLSDEYIPLLDEIKEISKKRANALPQLNLTLDYADNYAILTQLPLDQYFELGNSFGSQHFDDIVANYGKKRTGFCYAGDWSLTVYLDTGLAVPCPNPGKTQNIFENPDIPIEFEAVGNNCQLPFCLCGPNHLTWGVMPDVEMPTYGESRNRPEANWFTPKMRDFCNSKLCESNEKYGFIKRIVTNYRQRKKKQ